MGKLKPKLNMPQGPRRKYVAQPDPGPIDGTDLVMRNRAAAQGSAALLKAIMRYYQNREDALKS